MKNRMFISVFLIMAVLIIAGSCATDPMKYISKDYEIYGTWVNTDYYDKIRSGVKVYYPNNITEAYDTLDALEKGKKYNRYWYDITNKWIDRKGNIWYTTITIFGDKSWYYALVKISNNGKTLESNGTSGDYPKEISPIGIGSAYGIYYRE